MRSHGSRAATRDRRSSPRSWRAAEAGDKRGRGKTQSLEIHDEIIVVPATPVPAGSRFKGYDDFTVQDLVIRAHNTRYRIERWATPAGETVRGMRPAELDGGHFGATLRAFIFYQYHHAHVTQPLLHEQLGEWSIELSAGQLNRLITERGEVFHTEKEAVLRAGLQHSAFVHVDDTGARHDGCNGFATHIANEHFVWFASTESKSRINFLELLRAGDAGTVINAEACATMRTQSLPHTPLAQLEVLAPRTFEPQAAWQVALADLAITNARHVRIATEGALLGAVNASGINPALVIVSDDAGQFDVLTHAERGIHKLSCWAHTVDALGCWTWRGSRRKRRSGAAGIAV